MSGAEANPTAPAKPMKQAKLKKRAKPTDPTEPTKRAKSTKHEKSTKNEKHRKQANPTEAQKILDGETLRRILLNTNSNIINMSNVNTNAGEDTKLLSNSKRNSSTSNDSLRNVAANIVDGSPSSTSADGYEELFKDSVPCPSCRGLGRVPKELENQLVALIPMKDGRLKPRRTILYVSLAVVICLLTASLLIFFLMPRDINISSNRPFLQPKHIDINATRSFANFTVQNHYNVSNNNFYPVKITGVFMKAIYSNAVLAKTEAYRKNPLEISARTEADLPVPIDFVLSDQYGSLVSHCLSNWSWINNLPILFEVTANYSYMGHSEQATLTTFQRVGCHPQQPTPVPTPHATTTEVHTTTAQPTTKKVTTSPNMSFPQVVHMANESPT